jgi:hypothetical protein
MMRHLSLVLILLCLVACGAPPTATPDFAATQVALAVAATLTASTPAATDSVEPTATPIPVLSPTPTPKPPPLPTATSPSLSACPPQGNPPPPSQPATFDEIPAVIEAYLSAGAGTEQLGGLLRSWGAITTDTGIVRSIDMTGDPDPEIVVSLIDPSPGAQIGPWPPGDLLILQCQLGSVSTAYRGRLAAEEDWDWNSFHLDRVEDVNGTGLPDLIYTTRSCGAHTCFDRLYVIEWDGTGFVNRVPNMESYPYPTFSVGDGQILVDSVGFGSVGAGIQRGHREIWTWNGDQFALTEQLTGPPLALIHYVHDGDAALVQGDYTQAIAHYQAAISTADLPSGLFPDEANEGTAVVQAYARFKLTVASAAADDRASAENHYNLLVAEHPPGTPGHPYLLLAQAFWNDLLAGADPWLACATVGAVAQTDPMFTEMLYAGYGNPMYEPEQLCALPE